jgi:hypothetical protein
MRKSDFRRSIVDFYLNINSGSFDIFPFFVACAGAVDALQAIVHEPSLATTWERALASGRDFLVEPCDFLQTHLLYANPITLRSGGIVSGGTAF